MKAEIISVGSELLLGDIVNTNASYIAQQLAEIGIDSYFQTVVGDNQNRLKSCIKLAFSRSDMIIACGGLGPTYDDVTKEVFVDFFDTELVLHEPSLQNMLEYFKKTKCPITKNNKKQALIPIGATIFPNNNGTAPGFALEKEVNNDNKYAILLPGPPKELILMFEDHVKPYLLNLSNKTLVSHNLHVYGIGESALESQLSGVMKSQTNPTIAPYAKYGEIVLRVTASAKNKEQAEKIIKPTIDMLLKDYENYIYGIDVKNLQNAFVNILLQKNKTVATAESCTGGLISSKITEISGSSKVFKYGFCTYSEKAKEKLLGVSKSTISKYGVISAQTALEMAKGARRVAGSDIGLAVTGIAGPTGGTDQKPVGLVYISASSKYKDETKELYLSRGRKNERENIRNSAALAVLHLGLQHINML